MRRQSHDRRGRGESGRLALRIFLVAAEDW